MNKKTIETLSVDAVRDSIVQSDYLDQFIPDNDKEPCWDGHVYIYTDKSKKKAKLKGRMPVQVKGSQNDNLSKNEIVFPVSVIDLEKYLHDGGIVFFVVYIGHRGITNQIYYAELPPIKIRVLLAEAKNQKTKNIRLKKFPNDGNEKASIFFNCLGNCQKQSSFSQAKLYSLEELERQGVLEGITFSVPAIGKKDPIVALMTNEIYMYAQIKGSAIPQPLEFIPQKITTKEERNALVTVREQIFYEKEVIIQDANTIRILFGESITITYARNSDLSKLSFNPTKNLRALLIDLDFMLSYISEGSFNYNGRTLFFDKANADLSNFSIERANMELQNLKKVVQLLDMLGCKKDINRESLSKRDWESFNTLISALIEENEIEGFDENTPPIIFVEIGELNLMLYLHKVENRKGKFRVFDFFKTELLVMCKNNDGEEVPVSQYTILHPDDFINVSNLKFDLLLPSFQKIENHNGTLNRANYFMLDLLSAYDKSKNPEILETAKSFSNWIMTSDKKEIPYDVRLLNILQIAKRERELNTEERKKLFSIIENPNSDEGILTGAYLLLGQQDMAQFHFERLDKDAQTEFKKYPIYHFWENP